MACLFLIEMRRIAILEGPLCRLRRAKARGAGVWYERSLCGMPVVPAWYGRPLCGKLVMQVWEERPLC